MITDEIKELCSELTMENKKYVAAVAKALYFAQNVERASAFQKMGFWAEDPQGSDTQKNGEFFQLRSDNPKKIYFIKNG